MLHCISARWCVTLLSEGSIFLWMLDLFLINICYIKNLCCFASFSLWWRDGSRGEGEAGSRSIWSHNSSNDTNVTEVQSNYLSSRLFILSFLARWVLILCVNFCLVVRWKTLQTHTCVCLGVNNWNFFFNAVNSLLLSTAISWFSLQREEITKESQKGLERTLGGQLAQPLCSEKRHLELEHVVQSPVQPKRGYFQG